MHSCRLLRLGMAMSILQQWFLTPLSAQQDTQVIKAAYIRNVLNFARWPNQTFASTHTPFRLALVGNDKELEASLRLAFEQLNHRIQNRKVELVLFKTPEELKDKVSTQGSRTCHALFIPTSEEDKTEWINTVKLHPILLISDDPKFVENGGTVSLVPKEDTPNRYIYHIHLKRLRTQKLRFHAEFLRIRSAVKIISK